MRKLIISATLAAVAAGALAGSLMIPAANARIMPVAYPRNFSRTQVDEQIKQVIVAGYGQGFRQVIANERGAMFDDRRPSVFTVWLERGVEYRIAARCDSDCFDLDVVLKDLAGRELIADRDFDDTPSFTFRPQRSGEYVVQLEWAEGIARRSQVGAVVLARA